MHATSIHTQGTLGRPNIRKAHFLVPQITLIYFGYEFLLLTTVNSVADQHCYCCVGKTPYLSPETIYAKIIECNLICTTSMFATHIKYV